jgi:hypothetical protein
MTINLDRLPFDILYSMASGLQVDDIVHLSQTCQQLRALLDEDTLLRYLVEV